MLNLFLLVVLLLSGMLGIKNAYDELIYRGYYKMGLVVVLIMTVTLIGFAASVIQFS